MYHSASLCSMSSVYVVFSNGTLPSVCREKTQKKSGLFGGSQRMILVNNFIRSNTFPVKEASFHDKRWGGLLHYLGFYTTSQMILNFCCLSLYCLYQVLFLHSLHFIILFQSVTHSIIYSSSLP